MTTSNRVSRPGKCAPRLIEDIFHFDIFHYPRPGHNALIQPAVRLDHGRVLSIQPPPGACRHSYMTKPQQSQLPLSTSPPDAFTQYKIASYCSECRCHLTLTVDFRQSLTSRPCPNLAAPVHHFRFVSSQPAPVPLSSSGFSREQFGDCYRFECSVPACSARVSISVIPPRLEPEHVSLLTDVAKIKERAQREIENAPERFQGFPIPEPVVVLQTLRQYLNDAMTTREPRKFPASNKKFSTALGESCRPLLEYLGFQYSEEISEDGQEPDGFWTAPTVQVSEEAPAYQDPVSVLVDDVVRELTVLIDKHPWPERTKVKANVGFQSSVSLKGIQRCLGCIDYDRSLHSRRTIDLTDEDNPYYAALGALADFSDELLIFAYERQRGVDPENAPFYLECLQEIAGSRQSEALQTRVAVVESSGEVSRRDIQQAYQYFQVDSAWDDGSIIGAFQARVADAPMQEAEARQHLRVIGIARQSESIQAAASNRIATYEEALTWLGADDSTNDEFIVSLFTMKIGENSADMELAREAVRLIAEKRQSNALRQWLNTGQLGDVEMGPGQAYTRLGIEDRTLEDDVILSIYHIRFSEAPSQEEDLRSALRAIGKERASEKIASFLHTGQASGTVASDWPVGLENIGNTCYLNSLLQFYFTVKPLRDLILNFHEVEMKMTPENLSRKRVGSRRVTINEIERAKKFVNELQKLFQTLITAQTAAITPERELARLTLIKSSDEEDFRRRSITSPRAPPGLGEIDGNPIQGPTFPLGLSSQMVVDTEKPNEDHGIDTPRDDASDVTLVNGVPAINDTGDQSQDGITIHSPSGDAEQESDFVQVDLSKEAQKEAGNESPPEEISVPDTTGAAKEIPQDETDQTKDPQQLEQDQTRSEDVNMTNGLPPSDSGPNSQPPDRPPPIPPRPKSLDTKQQPVDELELGAQQDVTEVIGNVLFQLECAMRPISIDSNGEQHDEIKQLFYGKFRAYIEVKGGPRIIEEYFSDIKVDVASGPRDIYDALDGAFDVQEVIVKDGKVRQYSSVAQLPPILQIQIQRVQYDVKNKKTYKSDAHLRIRETIYLDRYMDSTDPTVLQRRQEMWRWKAELAQLEARRAALTNTETGMSVPEVLTATKDWLESLQSAEVDGVFAGDKGLTDSLLQQAEEANLELKDIESLIEEIKNRIENQFIDMKALPYRLAAVFIHRGTATFGHYWIYIYDFKHRMWRKYNDGYVTEVKDEREIYEQEPRYPATPYYLVYVKDELKDRVVEPVYRAVQPQPSSQPSMMVKETDADVEMEQREWPAPDEEGTWGAWQSGDDLMVARRVAGHEVDGDGDGDGDAESVVVQTSSSPPVDTDYDHEQGQHDHHQHREQGEKQGETQERGQSLPEMEEIGPVEARIPEPGYW